MSLIGAENEAWVSNVDGEPFDPSGVLGNLNEFLNRFGFGSVATEPGPGSVEFVSAPRTSAIEVAECLRSVAAAFSARAASTRIKYQAHSPWHDPGCRGLNTKNPRYAALAEAAFQESRLSDEAISRDTHGALFAQLNFWAALHVHVSNSEIAISPNQVDDRAAYLTNIVNLMAPFLARALCDKYGVVRNPGHLTIYRGWVRAERLPLFGRWYSSGEEYVAAFNRTPRLIKSTGPCSLGSSVKFGEWEPDLSESAQWGNPADDGSTWWHFCRLRPKYGTVELRFMPSWPQDERLQAVVEDLMLLVELVLDSAVQAGTVDEFLSTRAWRTLRDDINTRMFPYQQLGFHLPDLINLVSWQEACAA